jgi:hypothetical protein
MSPTHLRAGPFSEEASAQAAEGRVPEKHEKRNVSVIASTRSILEKEPGSKNPPACTWMLVAVDVAGAMHM